MTAGSNPQVGDLVEHLFRQQSGRMISTLVGIFGLQHLALVEDAVQEAMLKALRQWSFGTIPNSPSAWLMQVAKNRALDLLRRDSRWRAREAELASTMERDCAVEHHGSDELRDDQLRMIFACCHPDLGRSAQVALTLKTLCGLNVAEIARAFLIPEETAAKRLTRARQALQKSRARFEIPEGAELAARLNSVHEVLYLLFNEGYNASAGTELIRRELTDEAIRLCRLLATHPTTSTPVTDALLALFLLQAARFPARTSTPGEILLLADQDRSLWDKRLIAEGMAYLDRSAAGEKITRFHLEAGISACHAAAVTYETTDWRQILSLYDTLLARHPSPVVALNRAVAVGKAHGSAAGLEQALKMNSDATLQNYYLLYAIRAELYLQVGDSERAAENYTHALRLTAMPAERQFLERRLRECAANRESS